MKFVVITSEFFIFIFCSCKQYCKITVVDAETNKPISCAIVQNSVAVYNFNSFINRTFYRVNKAGWVMVENPWCIGVGAKGYRKEFVYGYTEPELIVKLDRDPEQLILGKQDWSYLLGTDISNQQFALIVRWMDINLNNLENQKNAH